jgi:hypothetical protein
MASTNIEWATPVPKNQSLNKILLHPPALGAKSLRQDNAAMVF